MGILTYQGNRFYLDGKPYTVRSGAMHYFRIPRAYWLDRLVKLKECGFNTVETYTCWNLHEPKEGEFDFSGNLDIEAYIRTAADVGLNVILRPGPYICAEWEFGGLPAWLLTYEKMDIRCNDRLFLSKVRRYFRALSERVRPYLAVNGGNMIMLQIENEYGSYGDDRAYLRAIAEIYKEIGMDCLFFTSDGAGKSFQTGSLEEYLCTANFGSNPKAKLGFMHEFRPDQPLMCGEYWCGWFDHWFEKHHIRPTEEIVSDIRDFMEMNASFNLYMFHGGTNFGFTNGANYGDQFEPSVTSYDYNAPLSEAGDRTEAYYLIRDTIGQYGGALPPLTAKDSKKAAYGKLTLPQQAALFDNLENLSSPVASPTPKYMEDLGQAFGYTLYRSTVNGPRDDWQLHIDTVHDRAQIFLDGAPRAVFERWNPAGQALADIRLPLSDGESVRLDILVENMGRVNYGHKLWDRKGIHGVRFHLQQHFGWEMYPLPMTDLSSLQFKELNMESAITHPTFLRGILQIAASPKDTFLRLDGFTKGFVTVNGINIGRYFNPAGPQKTLYVPAPFLRQGKNEIIVFESDRTVSNQIEFLNRPDLGEA